MESFSARVLPARTDGDGTTARALVGDRAISDDALMPGGVLQSGEKRGAATEGLNTRYANHVVLFAHVEGHAAAYMRRPGAPTEMTLVINNPPCGSPTSPRANGPGRCHTVLPKALPAGSTMHVLIAENGQITDRITYVGTGEALA